MGEAINGANSMTVRTYNFTFGYLGHDRLNRMIHHVGDVVYLLGSRQMVEVQRRGMCPVSTIGASLFHLYGINKRLAITS
jgi:hypothetical protein